jgi:hypothetical protein
MTYYSDSTEWLTVLVNNLTPKSDRHIAGFKKFVRTFNTLLQLGGPSGYIYGWDWQW